jgi:hypothetical protein
LYFGAFIADHDKRIGGAKQYFVPIIQTRCAPPWINQAPQP